MSIPTSSTAAPLWHGLEDALLGYAIMADGRSQAVYSYTAAIQVLIDRDGLNAIDAIDYLQYNVVHAYIGDQTPIWVYEADFIELDPDDDLPS